jgi:dTDP-4-amino-4,6-dideoxygalactose transaminase
MFTPYSKLSADAQAALKLKALVRAIPTKRARAWRVLQNAIRHLEGREIHPDNKNSVRALWSSLQEVQSQREAGLRSQI